MYTAITLLALATAQLQGTQTADAREAVQHDLVRIESRLATLKTRPGIDLKRLPDAEWYSKGVSWGLRYDSLKDPDIELMRKAIRRGNERLDALESNVVPWQGKRGRLSRAYRSEVDGSVQPYGLIIPQNYDPSKQTRLDVVLHGSTRPVGMSELRYVMPFDEGDTGGNGPTDHDYIELYPLGRVENCYRWAGETDVFEAIEDVCRNYNIDRNRIVLRGMSMGASGTWHLGLKHPDVFVALGPYCGYVDTHRFSETPGMNFVKVGPLPEVQELGLHMLDSVDYAANAGVVPCIAAIGENDPFFQAHVIMGEAFKREGIPFTNLISPGTAHVQEPKTWAEQMRQIGEYAQRGLDRHPKHVRFVTWTLKYSRCHWVEVLGLGRHYHRAEIIADRNSDGIDIKEPANITRFALYESSRTVRIGAATVRIPDGADARRGLVFEKHRAGWRYTGPHDNWRASGKRPGIQGPIDDAFTRRFLCVRGTDKPWSATIDFFANLKLKSFQDDWRRFFRGELLVKDDTAVTAEDLKTCNLILFGDPGSNRLIREAMPRMPVGWTKTQVSVGKLSLPSENTMPAFIAPSPFSRDHYVVVNSGHTFGEAELNRLNYLLFPRLGDWALYFVGRGRTDPAMVVRAGYFDENWMAR